MTGQDDRQHPRIEASFSVRSGAIDPERELPGVDLSKGGLFVRTDRFLPVNSVVRLSIYLEGRGSSLPATCRVVFVRDVPAAQASGKPVGMGLELLDMPEDKRRLLDELIDPKAPPPSGPRPPRASDSLSVLVVDDDAHYRELAAEPFRKRGDHVRTTADGLEALSICLKDPPDVILTDVQMPRMDGWQLLRLVRARPSLASVPVIFLTMLDGDNERLMGYQLGVDAYIAKPYVPEQLLIKVHQIVRRAQATRSSPLARTTLRGDLDNVAPPALLSFLELERKTGVLLLIGSGIARLFVKDGRVLRAELEGTRAPSRAAVMTAFDWHTGQFEFSPQEVPDTDDVKSSVSALLLEHARLADEKKQKR